MNSKWLTLMVFGSFCVLSSYGYGTAYRGERHIVQSHTLVMPWSSKKAAIIADIYGIKADELETATNIFGE